jgi:hypothetical protein
LNWNQELKLPKDIRTTEKDINVEAVPEEEEAKEDPIYGSTELKKIK